MQYLADLLWKGWPKEYLTTLHERNKWRCPVRNLDDEDVLVVEVSMPRSQWRLGKIHQTERSADGLVRKAKVRIEKKNVMERPTSKLVPLLGV